VVDSVTGAVNTALAAQTAVVAARALGIDSLVTNGSAKPTTAETPMLRLLERAGFIETQRA
jgi:hypothetical protein